MCRSQSNNLIERKEGKIEDFCATSLDFTIDQNNNVILPECPLCFEPNTKAYIFVCGCKYVGLLCEDCLDILREDLFFCICFEKKNFQLMPLPKKRILPLLHQRRLYLLDFLFDD